MYAKAYEVQHDLDRKRKGLAAWAVVEIIEAGSPRLVCRHVTFRDAIDTIAALEFDKGQWWQS